MENYALLQKLVDELNSSNSTLDKTAVLQKSEYNDPFIKAVIRATYNPFKQYYVTPANLKKNSHLTASSNADLFGILKLLSTREITGHDAIALVNGYVRNFPEYKELIYNILDRNLKTRMSDKIINKVFSNLIPTFDVLLAKKYEDHQKKVDFATQTWFASRKLDGLRCIAIIDEDGSVELFSRTGKTFYTLDLVKQEIAKLNLRSTVFDGEICIVDENDNEDFNAIQSEWNRKDHTIPNPRYKIFDMLTLEEFEAKQGTDKYSIRFIRLGQTIPADNNILTLVEQVIVEDENHLQVMRDNAKELGWEGIMIRKDIPYEGKRSDKLLKCKYFQNTSMAGHDEEFKVVDIELGDQRVIVEVNGKTKEVTENMMRKAIILYKGNPVGVGSGWSIDQRRYYRDHPDELIGSEITVQYFEVTTDKTGKESLRFPTVKAVWKGKRNV